MNIEEHDDQPELWEIKRLPEFSASLQDYLPNLGRAEQFVASVVWGLQRDPRRGMPISEKTWFVPAPSGVPDVGNLAVYYTFTEHNKTVYLVAIKQAMDGDV